VLGPGPVNLNEMYFSTLDRDNDGHHGYNCAMHFGGGWWFRNCAHAFFNIIWSPGSYDVRWYQKFLPVSEEKETFIMIK
jgi:hypothetical protein